MEKTAVDETAITKLLYLRPLAGVRQERHYLTLVSGPDVVASIAHDAHGDID